MSTMPLVCRICGGGPAVGAGAGAHVGILVVMMLRRVDGPLCRDCGIAAVRRMSAITLWAGWWGLLSFIFGPLILLINLLNWSRFRRLPPPVRAPGSPPPLDLGKPLYRRVAILGPLLPIGLLVFAAIASG